MRIIPYLDVDAGYVIKDVNFENLCDTGDPVKLASRYDTGNTDGITFLDISASSQGRAIILDVVAKTAEKVFVPFTAGGGVRSVGDVARLLTHGADRVDINTAAITDPDLISGVTDRSGDQVLVLSVGARRCPEGVTAISGFEVATYSGKCSTGIDALEWALKIVSLDAEEILLNPIDTDGVRTGFDPEMLNVFRSKVTILLITSGETGTSEHFLEMARTGADALLAASISHFGKVAISDMKGVLHMQGFEVHI